jgi:polyhydroxybutyrate depolymerase
VGGSEGCQRDNLETGLKNVSIQVGSTKRSYIRVVSFNYNRHKKHALVIGFHGAGLDGNSPRFHHKWPLIETMAGDEAIFIYPNGLGGRWNAGAKSADALFFDELVRSTGEEFCIDKNRVFIHGISNGSFFVNALVPFRKEAIRGVISVAGGGSGSKMPAMVIHGASDPTIKFSSSAQNTLVSYAKANGCKTPIAIDRMKFESCQLLEGCPPDLPVWFCPWNGNHHWPEFSLTFVWRFISSFQ